MSVSQQKSKYDFKEHLARRNRIGRSWGAFFYISNFIGLTVLIILILHVANSSIGLVVVRNTVEPSSLSERPLQELSAEELARILVEQMGNRIRVLIRDRYSVVPNDQFPITPIGDALGDTPIPEDTEGFLINELSREQFQQLLLLNMSQGDLLDALETEIIRPVVAKTWNFLDSILRRDQIEAEAAEKYPGDRLQFRSWISWDFISSSVSSSATTAGLRTALLGSFLIISITATTALIVGVSAAIYLQEYAKDNWFNRLIEINIRNLAAIPSIIYGMLGLAVFAQALAVFTGGYLFGVNLPTQAADQIVSYVQTAFDQPALNSAEREAVREAAAQARGNPDIFVQIIVDHITTDKISEGQKEALARLFLTYRVPSLSTFTTFSTPSIEQARADIERVIGKDLLDESHMAGLAENLRVYGTFNINGRTVLSAGFTLALLILPIVIVNAQEAILAVPSSIREASYGLGATKWQTVSRQVLPAALPGIMTGVILAVSRAIGETAPLLVVGASTFIGIDPNGPFSKFTVVPIQIYQWTARPGEDFRAVAAAAIIVLLAVMLLLNGLAIFIRQRFSRRF
ncbi:MAG: ABC transporter permease subunit [Anaerolineae bacterium]|nr:ABC transporter permease subunit [Anaerolineae bacterium]